MKYSDANKETISFIYTVILQNYYSEENKYVVENAIVNLNTDYHQLPSVIDNNYYENSNDIFFEDMYENLLRIIDIKVIKLIDIFNLIKRFSLIFKIVSGVSLAIFFILFIFKLANVINPIFGIIISLLIVGTFILNIVESIIISLFIKQIKLSDIPYILNHNGFRFTGNISIVNEMIGEHYLNREIIEKIGQKLISTSIHRDLRNSFCMYLLCQVLIDGNNPLLQKEIYITKAIESLEYIYAYNQESDWLKYKLGILNLSIDDFKKSKWYFSLINQNTEFKLYAQANIELINYLGKI